MEIKLKRAQILVDVLLPVEDEQLFNDMNLMEVLQECLDGGWSLKTDLVSMNVITDDECQAACDEHGTDMEFFFMDDGGEEEYRNLD